MIIFQRSSLKGLPMKRKNRLNYIQYVNYILIFIFRLKKCILERFSEFGDSFDVFLQRDKFFYNFSIMILYLRINYII